MTFRQIYDKIRCYFVAQAGTISMVVSEHAWVSENVFCCQCQALTGLASH